MKKQKTKQESRKNVLTLTCFKHTIMECINERILLGIKMAFDESKFDLDRIKKNYNISQASIDGLPFKENELEDIYNDFRRTIPELEKKKNEILSYLNEELGDKVHSIRGRVKEPDHLIEKIIRNVNGKPDKYGELGLSNYNKIITDLIGIRVIILDKRQWRAVHDVLLKVFRNELDMYVKKPKDIEIFYDKFKDEFQEKNVGLGKAYHAEKPVVYITSEDDREIYKDANLKIDNSKSHYRSIRYIIRYKEIYFEIQVRTLFEEGWLEFDHQIKYPYDQNNRKKQEYANILSNLAIAADNLISFYDEKRFEITDFKKERKEEASSAAHNEDDNPKDTHDKMIKRY